MRQWLTDPSHRVLSALADGQPHRHTEIAHAANVAAEQLSAVLSQLVDAGVALKITPENIVLEEAAMTNLLDAQILQMALAPAIAQRIDVMKINAVCASTNDVVAVDAQGSMDGLNVAISDAQTSGRGRQGNLWVSPFGGGIYMSLATQWLPTSKLPNSLPSNLPLAIGVAVAEQLQALVVDRIQLKWPNDLMANDRKLGGLLLESRAHPDGGYRLVIGIGINLETPDLAQSQLVEEPRTVTAMAPIGLRALAQVTGLPDRSMLTAMVLNTVVAAIDLYRNEGFACFHARWQQRDYLFKRPIQMHAPRGSLSAQSDVRGSEDGAFHGIAPGITSGITQGIAGGINADGTLRVITDVGECNVSGGEVSIRCD